MFRAWNGDNRGGNTDVKSNFRSRRASILRDGRTVSLVVAGPPVEVGITMYVSTISSISEVDMVRDEHRCIIAACWGHT